MKRIPAITLMLLLLSILPAQAEIWFPDEAGTQLHRDPFCIQRILSLESYCMPSLYFESKDRIIEAGVYAVCENCDTEIPALPPASDELYYNPNGGKKLHYDPECPSVASKYRPMISAGLITADALPEKICHICATRPIESPSDTRAWNASAAEKASILPGVWTLPSEHALSEQEAYDAAHEWMRDNLPTRIYAICPMHYDSGLEAGDQHETWKVIVLTSLRHPVCILYLDAISGEVYGVERAAEFLTD